MDRHLWQTAASFAARAHQGQLRKDKKTPYFAHVSRVALTLAVEFGCTDEIALCTAYLHDTIEDTPTDFDDIHTRFGAEVATCVAAMTKNMILIEPLREKDYDQRLSESPWQARIVKLADTYDNLTDIWTRPKGINALSRGLVRCERAISLAEPLAGENPMIRRGIQCVRDLVTHVQSENSA